MAKEAEFFGVKYKKGSLEPKVGELIRFAVNIAIGNEHGAKRHLEGARKCRASEDEVWETVVFSMRPVAAKVRNFARGIIGQ